MSTTTTEFQGYVIDATSRQYAGQENAVGFFRPLRGSDLPDYDGHAIDPRWVLVEWRESAEATEAPEGVVTVGWREGDAVFVPSDATLAHAHYDPDGPTNDDGAGWTLAESPSRAVLVMPEADGKRTLVVMM